MTSTYQACWISRDRFDRLRKAGIADILLLDSLNGYILVEPTGSSRGDGMPLSPDEADWELQPVWYTGPKTKLLKARRLLDLEIEMPSMDLVGAPPGAFAD